MPVQPTWIRWYNSAEGAKITSADTGRYEDIPYGAVKDSEKHAEGKPPHPQYGQWQWGLACSKTSRVIVIDIDKPEHWGIGDTDVVLGNWADICTSYREDGERAHIVVEVPQELLDYWPRQGTTVWGDVKSNGFSYEAGVHYTGMRYVSTGRAWLTADRELLTALMADRVTADEAEATGATSGRWGEEGYTITSDNQLTADIMSMVANGKNQAEIQERLTAILRPLAEPWTPAQIEGKIASAERKVAELEARENAMFLGYSPDGTIEGLIALKQRQLLSTVSMATPAAIQQDTTEWIKHQVSEGVSLLHTPLADRLNPMHRPIEPRHTNDKGNALEILEAGLSVFRYAADEGCYIRNTGTHWETWGNKSEKQEIGRAIVSAYGAYFKTEEMLSEELSAQGTAGSGEEIGKDDKRKERLLKNRIRYTNSQGQSTISTSLITEARATERYNVLLGELDTEPDVLWAGGYPWSLVHPQLTLMSDVRVVNPVHMKTAACAPSPGPAPAWDQVLSAVWPDPDVRAWALREIAGVALWGSTSKSHPVLDGTPGGGKSTFALILTTILGGYAVQVSPDKILGADTSSAHEEEVAAMIGARCVWMDEPPPGGKQSISRFNDLASGTGKLSAARKYQNRISAPKLFNFLICQNPRNGLRMDAQGVGERMTFIPCNGDPDLTKLAWERWKKEGQAEYPAVLAALIRECALFHTGQRLPIPGGAVLGRMDAQERADEFGTWLLEHYTPLAEGTLTNDPALGSSPTLGALRTEYNDTCARPNRQPVVSPPEAKDQLARLGIRVATAGADANKRRKDIVFVMPKSYTIRY